MNPSPTIIRPTRRFLFGLLMVGAVALAIGWTAGTVAASTGSHAAAPASGTQAAGQNDLGASGVGTTTNLTPPAGGVTASGGSASTGAAILYPMPGYNSLGVAPQGTILAAGTGTADMKADGSDKAAALKTATVAALADARSQALAAAAAMGVGLGDVYSMSISSNVNYAYPTPDCVLPPLVPGAGSGAAGSAAPATSSVVCGQPNVTAPTSAQLVVTLIVAYKYA
ncbi:MAG: SIMPL domain-containing protein [Candidatus Limnocylindrales bacterium]